jgi:hypothetical protein
MSGRFAGPRCGAKTRRGTECQQPAMPNGRCRLHGGKIPSGIGSPHFKHGRYSDFMPERLLSGYARMVRDPELLNQRDEIALLDSMIFEVLKKLGSADSAQLWQQLREAWKSMEEGNRRGGPEGLRQASEAIAMMGELIRRGAHEYQQQEYVLNLMDRKRRFIESQSKREVQERMVLSYEDASLIFSEIGQAVREALLDHPHLLAEIGIKWAEITGRVPYLSEN